MSPEPFFRTGSDVHLNAHARFDRCQNCSQVTPDGFCCARIHPQCQRIDPSGGMRISLSVTAQTWFNTLSQLGQVLHLTQNSVAVMGKLEQVPALRDWRNDVFPRDRRGFFSPNLAEYASLWAVREVSSKGVLHGLEVQDVSGVTFDRYLLPKGTRRELFEQFVTAHQSPPEDAVSWFPPNHVWSARRRAKLAGRIPWLRMRWNAGDRNIRRLPLRFVSRLLAAAAREHLEIRTGLYHPALTRILQWTPENSSKSRHEDGSLEFFHGSSVGLRLNRPHIAGVWLWSGQCDCCANHNWSVEVAGHRDQICLNFMAADDVSEAEWRALIKSCLS